MMHEPTGVLLAAGSATRFGADKLQQPLSDGTTVCVAAARCLLQALPHCIAVVKPDDHALAKILTDLGMKVLVNPRHAQGMGTSLAAAIHATADADGWLIALADMPWIQTATMTALAQRLQLGASMVAPIYKAQRGHPVGFASRWRQPLQALTGDRGARDLITQHADELELIMTEDAGVLQDIDYPLDLAQSIQANIE